MTGGPPDDESLPPPVAGSSDPPPPPMLETLSPGPFTDAPTESSQPAWMDLLRNRFILGGLGLVAVLTLTAIVLVAVGSGDGDSKSVTVNSRTPDPNETVVVRGGLPGRMLRTVSMRSGPGITFPILGTLPRQALVAVIGRSEDSEWLQINYPIGSRIKGWVQSDFVRVTGNVATLPIGAPSEGPEIIEPTFIDVEPPPVDLPTEPIETTVPTEPPVTSTPVPPTEAPTFEPTPVETPAATETPPAFGGASAEADSGESGG